MRLWTLHPKYLDPKGLVALWREALLAQKVLKNETKGYKNHPQLHRFRETPFPSGAISSYLRSIAREADRRGYSFDKTKIDDLSFPGRIVVTSGQIDYETEHLRQKLEKRSAEHLATLCRTKKLILHPLFKEIQGDIEFWEKTDRKKHCKTKSMLLE